MGGAQSSEQGLKAASGHQSKFAQRLNEAESGAADAQFDLGCVYQHGIKGLVEADLDQALAWYRKAAEQVRHFRSVPRSKFTVAKLKKR